MAISIITANPGFNALCLCTNEAGRLSYDRKSIIAWQIIWDDGIAQNFPSSWAIPVLPGFIYIYEGCDAIEHPNGAVQTEQQTFKTIGEWLKHEETKEANHEA